MGKKNFILTSLACLSIFGGSVEAMQRSNSAPRMIVRNDEIVSGKEFNQAMQTANTRGAIGTLFGTVAGAGVSGAITYSFMNKNVKELTDKVDRLTKENEELKKKLEEKGDDHPGAPLGDAEKDAKIENLKEKNEILLDACKKYHKSTKEFFEDLRNKTKHIKDGARTLRVKIWNYGFSDVDGTIEELEEKFKDNKELTNTLKTMKSAIHGRMSEAQEYVTKTMKDNLKLEELFDDFPRNISGYITLVEDIKGKLALKDGIDLDKD